MASQYPKSSIYLDPRDAELLRELASALGLLQVNGGGARYQAGSLSALMRFLAAASVTHRGLMLEFLRALQKAADVQQHALQRLTSDTVTSSRTTSNGTTSTRMTSTTRSQTAPPQRQAQPSTSD